MDALEKAGLISIPITLIILILAFGALVAAGIPLILALTAVLATFGLWAIPSQVLPSDESIYAMILLIGLAVGVDYSLFYLKREREERAAGRSPEAALEAAAATSGRSVLISGITVMIAMAGMLFAGKDFAAFGVATMLVVAVAVIGSLTVLPALLSKLGDNVDRLRVPFVHRLSRSDGEGRIWGAIVDRVLRRPVLSVALAGGLLLALALPALTLQVGRARARHLPTVDPRHEDVQPPAGGVPRHRDLGERRREGAEPELRRVEGGDRAAPVACSCHRPDASADHRRRQRRGHGRQHRDPDLGQWKRQDVGAGACGTPVGHRPADGRIHRRLGGGRRRLHGGVEGLQRLHEVRGAVRVRLRARVCVPAHAPRISFDRDRSEGDPAQPALGRGGLRRSRARLPARLGEAAASASRRQEGSWRSCRSSCS